MDNVRVVACISRAAEIKEHFVENPAHFVLKIDFLLTVLSNFEKEAVLGDSAF